MANDGAIVEQLGNETVLKANEHLVRTHDGTWRVKCLDPYNEVIPSRSQDFTIARSLCSLLHAHYCTLTIARSRLWHLHTHTTPTAYSHATLTRITCTASHTLPLIQCIPYTLPPMQCIPCTASHALPHMQADTRRFDLIGTVLSSIATFVFLANVLIGWVLAGRTMRRYNLESLLALSEELDDDDVGWPDLSTTTVPCLPIHAHVRVIAPCLPIHMLDH